MTENGKPLRVTKLEACIRTTTAKAIKGDARAMTQVIGLIGASKEILEHFTKTIVEIEFVSPSPETKKLTELDLKATRGAGPPQVKPRPPWT